MGGKERRERMYGAHVGKLFAAEEVGRVCSLWDNGLILQGAFYSNWIKIIFF